MPPVPWSDRQVIAAEREIVDDPSTRRPFSIPQVIALEQGRNDPPGRPPFSLRQVIKLLRED